MRKNDTQRQAKKSLWKQFWRGSITTKTLLEIEDVRLLQVILLHEMNQIE